MRNRPENEETHQKMEELITVNQAQIKTHKLNHRIKVLKQQNNLLNSTIKKLYVSNLKF